MKLEERYYAEKDYYEVLALQPDATCVEVQAAYDRLTQTISLANADPEARVRSAERMLELSQAYEVLNDPIQRSHYDIRTFGRHSLPIHAQVENLFREAIRAFRTRKTDMALHYFKEVSSLYPHRSLYRVHLAIAYADKDWLNFAEAELQTALRLDPEDRFAKETVARVLFKHEEFKREASPPLVKRMSASLRAVVRAATGRLDAPSSTDPLHPNAARPSTRGQDRAPRTRPLE